MYKSTVSTLESAMSSRLGGIGEANSGPSLRFIWSDKLDFQNIRRSTLRWAPLEASVQITRHPHDYEISLHFPDAREFHLAEGECVYASEVGGKFFLIMDSGTLLDGLDEQDRNDLLTIAIAVYEFSSHAERAEYLESRNIRENVRARW